jgi:hypothetical protein
MTINTKMRNVNERKTTTEAIYRVHHENLDWNGDEDDGEDEGVVLGERESLSLLPLDGTRTVVLPSHPPLRAVV